MATDLSARRLRKEYMTISKNPVENIQAVPMETNILEWHYVITGTKGTAYEGGHYHGKLKFPPEYPLKPPAVLMLTPNGRFACGKRLCLSMSDFHPETWNPMWSVSTILMGLYSFMLESSPTLGSVNSTTAQKRQLAVDSLAFNCKDKTFMKLFPELVELQERRKMARTNGSNLVIPSAKGSDGFNGQPRSTPHSMRIAPRKPGAVAAGRGAPRGVGANADAEGVHVAQGDRPAQDGGFYVDAGIVVVIAMVMMALGVAVSHWGSVVSSL